MRLGLGLGLTNSLSISSTLFPFVAADGVSLWLDILDPSPGLIDQTANNVSRWGDKSGKGNDLPQYTGSAQPTYVENAWNGYPAVRFDGVSHYLELLNTSLVTGNTLSLFVVARRITHASNYAGKLSLWETVQASDFNNTASVAFDDSTVSSDRLQTVRNVGGSPQLITFTGHPANGAPYIYSTLFDGVNNNSFLDGSAAGFTNPSASTGNFNIQNIILGARHAGGITQAFWNGDIFELIIASTAVPARLAAIGSYLNSKWAGLLA